MESCPNGGVDLALVIAIPIALLGSYLKTILYTFLSWFVHRADKYADEGDLNGVNRVHIITGLIIIVSLGLLTFVAILVGADAMSSFIDSIPQKVIDGFSVANGMLVAVGFGMLLNVMSTKTLIPFYFLGFILAAYLKVDTMFVAILAAIIAMVRVFGKSNDAKGDFNV